MAYLSRAMELAVELDRISRPIPPRYADRAGHDSGLAELRRAVGKADPSGVVTEDWHGAVVRACGIRATSTSGIKGAVSNWIRQVEAKSGLPLKRQPNTAIGE